MTEQQKLDMLRQILTAIGAVATALGFLPADVVANWIATIMQIAGPILTVAGIVWGFIANNKPNLIAGVAALPEVEKVKLDPAAPETPAINAATPANVGPNV